MSRQHRSAAVLLSEAALLRHRHVQPAQSAHAARYRRRRSHGHGERLSPPARIDRKSGELDRGNGLLRGGEGADLRGNRSVIDQYVTTVPLDRKLSTPNSGLLMARSRPTT